MYKRQGYTWAAGAAQDLGTYQALGMLDVPAKDWHLFLSVANIPVVGVGANTPYQNMQQLLDAMKAKPGEVKVATAGVTSGGHNAMEAISRATGVKYRHVTYDGGNPAVVATVSGETDITTQLAVEQAEMIRGKRIRPLATVSDRPLEIEGFGTIDPITKFVPGIKVPTNYFGIFIPKGVPPEVVATVQQIWNDQIAKSDALKKYATSRGALFAPVAGDAALAAAMYRRAPGTRSAGAATGPSAPRWIERSASRTPSSTMAARSNIGTSPGISYRLMCRFSSRSIR